LSGLFAQATFAVPSSATIPISATTGPPGSAVAVAGSNFGQSETVFVYFDSTSVATATTSGGAFSNASFTVPANASSGAHTVKATGQSSGLSAQATFTVQPLLPPTGALFGAFVAVGSHTGNTEQIAQSN